MLEFNVKEQELSRLDHFKPAAKSVGYLKAKINFLTDEWDVGEVKLRAQNESDMMVYEADVVDGIALVPWEVLDVSGTFSVAIFTDAGDVEITTNVVTIALLDTLDSGSDSNPPTPTELDKIKADIKELQRQVKEGVVSVDFETDDSLTLENGVLAVNTTNVMEQDNTLPITSAGVFGVVGNIEAILKTI